jgi:hypothetical protein
MPAKLKGKEPRPVTSIRLEPSEKALLIKCFGGVQAAVDSLLSKLIKTTKDTKMKSLILLSMLSLVSCNNNDYEPVTAKEVVTISKIWDSTSANPKIKSIDLTDNSHIVLEKVYRDGAFSDCEYDSVLTMQNIFYGNLNLTLTSGDAFICSQFSGDNGIKVVNSSINGFDTLEFSGHDFR